MISCIEWVPKGAAHPVPKRYELSSTEKELLQAMEENRMDEDNIEELVGAETISEKVSKIGEGLKSSDLPADLRMDEYSSDEDNEAYRGSQIGNMVVGVSPASSSNANKDNNDNEKDNDDDDGDDDKEGRDFDDSQTDGTVGELGQDTAEEDSDDEDMLGDVPDTREFVPVDVEGLEAMGLSESGVMQMEYGDENGGAYDDDSEAEDVKISPNDALVVVAKTDEDFASLEVHVYDQETGGLFVHHDIPLPSFPLCLAHGQVVQEGSTGNFCAVGTFDPGIEIWNLDVLNALEPSCILGGEDTTRADELMRYNMMQAQKQNKPTKMHHKHKGPSKLAPGSHTDAVMALSWNKLHGQVIASGSADCSVKIWDVTKAGSENCNAGTFNHHRDKVQSVLWHPTEASLLATGSFDRTVALVDARSSSDNVKKVRVPADCEALAWDPFHPEYLTVACEDGTIKCWDVRKFTTNSPLWSFVSNEFGGVSDLAYNNQVPGMLATCAVDKTVTLWDAHNQNCTEPPRPCGNKEMGVGKLYTVSFFPSAPWILGCGGSGKELAIWDMNSDKGVQHHFGSRVSGNNNQINLDEGLSEGSTLLATGGISTTKDQTNNKKKKKKGKNKKKVHRKGR